jgi:DNA-directed RNA polymerase specialized sigma24 family protein
VAKNDARTAAVSDEVLEWELPAEPSAEAGALETDRRARLWACVQQLSERCQRLLRIVAFDDKPDYKGIAEEMQIPIGSIGPTRGRCLAKLKALLAGERREMAHE